MQNSVLFRRASFFVDAINIIFHVDLFLYHELSHRMKECKFLEEVFTNIPKFEYENVVERDKMIINNCSKKIHQNILLDWISKDIFTSKSTGMGLNEYVAKLYVDMLVNPLCNEYLQSTEFGNTLRLLSNDRQLNKMFIYVPFESKLISESISNLFANARANIISITIGGKDEVIKNNKFDSYIFENVRDIDKYLINPENKVDTNILIEVIVPNYNYNLKEDRTDFEMLVEQITYHRLDLKLTNAEYINDYKLSINTMGVPF